jgi:hypothetical protein
MSTAYSSFVTSHSSTSVWMCSTDLDKREGPDRQHDVIHNLCSHKTTHPRCCCCTNHKPINMLIVQK